MAVFVGNLACSAKLQVQHGVKKAVKEGLAEMEVPWDMSKVQG